MSTLQVRLLNIANPGDGGSALVVDGCYHHALLAVAGILPRQAASKVHEGRFRGRG